MAIEENVDNLMEEYNSLNEKYEAMDGYNMEYKIKQVMQGLELNDFKESQIKSLSGGEKTRVTLAKLLLEDETLKLYPILIEYKGYKDKLIKLDSDIIE